MDKTPCLLCRRVGLVRFEVVVKGRDTFLTYYCGYCEKTRQERDRRVSQRISDKGADRTASAKAVLEPSGPGLNCHDD